jgi:hypothetical protein
MRRRLIGVVSGIVLDKTNYLDVVLISAIEKNYGTIKSLHDVLKKEISDRVGTLGVKEE